MNKRLIHILAAVMLLGSVFLVQPAHADLKSSVTGQLRAGGEAAGVAADAGDPRALGARIINAFLQLFGAAFLLMLIYGGYLYLTAGGNEDQVQKATGIIRNAIIGMIIVFSAYGIVNFIIPAAQNAIIES